MAEKSVYDQIKKQNGEAFAQEIRRFHNGIFELPNLKNIVKFAGRDAEPILECLLFLKQKSENENIIGSVSPEAPIKLLEKAGYKAYVADTLQKQNAIRKYFAKGEELCTFYDPYRYQKYYIINAVKKNVDQIKRENFPHPKRQDEYGTSVISIQILKTGGFISIKNRYNHTVNNPDNTFNSNPDNIIPGLSKTLEDYFNIRFTHSNAIDLPDNYIMVNNQIIHYTEEQQGLYFGDYYYVKDGMLHELNQDYQIMAGHFIIDLKNKKVSSPLYESYDSFPDVLNAEFQEKKLTLTRDKENNHYLFANNVQIMKINAKHEITEIYLPETKKFPDYFLINNKALKKFSAPNVQCIGTACLHHNEFLTELNAPKLEIIGDSFLIHSERLKKIDLPSAREIGNAFACCAYCCTSVNLPNVRAVGKNFMACARRLTELNAPKLEIIGDDFLEQNEKMEKIDLPSARQIGNAFACRAYCCTSVNLPNVRAVGKNFMACARRLTELNAPKLEIIGDDFLEENEKIEKIDLPSARQIGNKFLEYNFECASVNLPNVRTVGCRFLFRNQSLTKLNLPKLEIMGDDFLWNNHDSLLELNAPKLKIIGDDCLNYNDTLKKLDLPSVREIGYGFLSLNDDCTSVNLPNVQKIGGHFLALNKKCTSINLPKVEEIGSHFLDKNEHFANLSVQGAREMSGRVIATNRVTQHMQRNQNERS